MNLKLTKYTNTPGTFEAEWSQRVTLPQQEVAEGVADLALRTQDVVVRVIAYSGDQIDLFRADVAQYGGEIDEALLAEVQAEWVPPPPPPVVIPQSVTMRQARLALLNAGLLGDVDAAINALPSPQKEAARIEWEYSQEVQRHNGFVSQLAPALGLDDEALDNLFVTAAAI